jgi:hypothetical protein
MAIVVLYPPNQVSMKAITVKLDEKTITVSKLPIGKYPEVIKLGKEIFSYFSKFEKIDNQVIVEQLPDLIEKNIPTFMKLLAITTPVTEAELADYGLFELVELTVAVVEVNRYVDIYNRLKKVIARPGQATQSLTP